MIRLANPQSPRGRGSLLIIPLLIFLILSLMAVLSCNDEPAGVTVGDDPHSGSGNVDPGVPGEFLLASIDAGDHSYGRIEIWGKNLVTDPDAGTVSFDAVIHNATGSPVYPPIRFVVTSLVPRSVTVANASGYDRAGNPYFDFSDKLGPDGVLQPDERSQSMTFVFNTGAPGSFVIGYRFDFTWEPPGRLIVGVVFEDLNNNGIRERCEPGIAGVPVWLDSSAPDSGGVHLRMVTGEDGAFRFGGLKEGIYSVGSGMGAGWRPTTSNPVLVTLAGDQENLVGVMFGFFNEGMPPAEWTLFGPIDVGPMSQVGTELDSAFFVPPDTLRDTSIRFLPRYLLEVAYPPIMAPFPVMYDSALVEINGVAVYHYVNTGDPTYADPIPGVFVLPEGLIVEGENRIYIRVNGDEHAVLQFRVYASILTGRGC